jgi:hypothetical protein
VSVWERQEVQALPRSVIRAASAAGVASLTILGLVAATLTGWAVLGLLGLVQPPSPNGTALTPSDLASMSVAGATLLLATATVFLAAFTGRSLSLGRAELSLAEATLRTAEEQAKRSADQVTASLQQVKVTQDQADIARRSLEAGWRPFLVDVPFGYSAPMGQVFGITDAAVVQTYKRDDGSAMVGVSLRNIGSGLAIITKAGLSFGQLHTTATQLSSSIVGVGEVVRLTFDIKPEGAVLLNMVSQVDGQQPFIVTAIYTDQGGSNKWRSRAYFRRLAQAAQYEVEKVELYVGDEVVPFATTGTA